MNLQFRQPQPEEADALWQLALRSKQYWGYDAGFMDACQEELKVSSEKLADSKYVFRAGFMDDKLAGFFCLEKLATKDAEIDALFVDPDFIGHGFGRAFWQDLVSTAKRHKFSCLSIASDPFAEPFYLKMGAEKVGEIASGSIPGRVLPLLSFQL